MAVTRLISGDIGGTNSRLQLHHAEGGQHKPDTASPPAFSHFELTFGKTYASADFSSLAELLCRFLADAEEALGIHDSLYVAAACLGVCGPVRDEAEMCGPVLPEQPPTQWAAKASDLTTGKLSGRIGAARLVNDFIAVGLGLTELTPSDKVALHTPPPEVAPSPQAPIACVGAGTGLGMVYLVWDGKQYSACPSEGGMTDFTANNDDEWALRQWCHARDGYCTVESVVSGPGLANAFEWLVSARGMPDNITAGLGSDARHKLPEAVAARAGGVDPDPTATAALELVLKAWGAECRSVALRVLPFAGLYLAGGLTPKLLPSIQKILVPAFTDGDPLMGATIREVPLIAVVNEHVGLLGARVRAWRLLHGH